MAPTISSAIASADDSLTLAPARFAMDTNAEFHFIIAERERRLPGPAGTVHDVSATPIERV